LRARRVGNDAAESEGVLRQVAPGATDVVLVLP
jgi:hypothetical protein